MASSTGIWMVLLNLPPHLRYLEENIYVAGVIPGPSKPSNDQLNHYLELIVREAKELWQLNDSKQTEEHGNVVRVSEL